MSAPAASADALAEAFGALLCAFVASSSLELGAKLSIEPSGSRARVRVTRVADYADYVSKFQAFTTAARGSRKPS